MHEQTSVIDKQATRNICFNVHVLYFFNFSILFVCDKLQKLQSKIDGGDHGFHLLFWFCFV